MTNTVIIDLKTYNELFYKALKYDELKKENGIIVDMDKWNEISKSLSDKSKMNLYNNGGLL
ncbi:hypothetical protein ACFGC5_10210 [Staphylococcus xylosus]|uniref:hypothetical protein n=1 Tax=Staphylococcus xylosus TaxID=1288 RepID=UPI0035F56F01